MQPSSRSETSASQGARFALACASHTPMLLNQALADAQVCDQVRASFSQLGSFVQDFDADYIIQFSPDHFHGFLFNNMPSFCIGAAARSYGDWGTKSGPLRVDADFALSLLTAVRAADIDLSLAWDMTVDHGFVQIWEAMRGGFADLPIIPVFINSIAKPLPTYRRARMLGTAIGRHVASSGKRVLFAASGGLSHDPVVPDIRNCTPEVYDRLTGRTKLSVEQQAAREQQVLSAAYAALEGGGPARPLNATWDRDFLHMLVNKDWEALEKLDTDEVDAIAGSGANEVLCWVTAASAMAAATNFRAVQNDYLPIPGWIAGMAHFAAVSAPQD